MSINGWTDKEDVKPIYNDILFSHKKERNWVIYNDVDGPRVCQTELNKSEREKQTLYINSYTWTIERWYRWACLQARNRDTDIENKYVDTGGKGKKVRQTRRVMTEVYTLPRVKQIASGEGNAPHSSTLAWKIPWTVEPGGLQSLGSLGIRHDWETSLSLFTFLHWRRKWQPTPMFLLENPKDGGAWWAAVYGVTQSQTRLKRLSSSSRKLLYSTGNLARCSEITYRGGM